MNHHKAIGIIGGGAAGFFAAVNLIERFSSIRRGPQIRIEIIEKTETPLRKVAISGGGRCNLTHACFDPRHLVAFYPRGGKALLGPFSRFGPRETIEWFERHGVRLKTYPDNTIFPETNSSQTVIDCLLNGVNSPICRIKTETTLHSLRVSEQDEKRFILTEKNGTVNNYDQILLTTGSSRRPFRWLSALGHTIVPPVPSLFTFVIDDPGLCELAGIVVESITLRLQGRKSTTTGELLITHNGLSGPATLRLSSLEARHLADCDYRSVVEINWCGGSNSEEIRDSLESLKAANPGKKISAIPLLSLPARVWRYLIIRSGIDADTPWGEISRRKLLSLTENLCRLPCTVTGRNVHKQEFVTAGGVSLDEVNFRTMESRMVPGLFFAGEILDIDGFTGGFNFQNAWTTAWIAAQSMMDHAGD